MNATSDIAQKSFKEDTIHILWIWKFIIKLDKKGKLKQFLSEVLELMNEKCMTQIKFCLCQRLESLYQSNPDKSKGVV